MKMKTYLLLFVLFLLCISFPAAVGQDGDPAAVEQEGDPAAGGEIKTNSSVQEKSEAGFSEGDCFSFGHLPQDPAQGVIWCVLPEESSEESDGTKLIVVKDRLQIKDTPSVSVKDYLVLLNDIFSDDEKIIVENKIFFLSKSVTGDIVNLEIAESLSEKGYDGCNVEINEDINQTNITCTNQRLTDVYPALRLSDEDLSMINTNLAIKKTPTEVPSDTPVPSDTVSPTQTPSDTPVPTDTISPTPTPSDTPAPADTIPPTQTPEPGPVGFGGWLSKNWLFLVGGVVLLAGAGVGIGVIGRGKNNDEENHKNDDHDDDNEDYGHGGDDEGPDDSEGPLAGRTDPPARHTGNTIKPVPTVTTISRLGVYHCSSCLGQGKRNYQEDALWVSEKDPVRPIVCAVIADGMGGMENGKESSALAIKIISSRVEQFLQSGANMDDIPAFLRQMAIDANEAIYEMNSSQGMNGGATLICTLIIKNWLYWINIGDSRIYLYRDGMLAAISEEHELENRMYNGMISGEVDLYDIREMQYRELRKLTSNLGRSSVTIIDQNFIPYRLHQGDKLLLCSDGISGSLTEDEIIECMRDLDPIANCSWLKEKVEQLDKPGQDNYSAIVVACATEDGNEN